MQHKQLRKSQDLKLEQIGWADWFGLAVLQITVGIAIALTHSDSDLAAMWIIAGTVTNLVTATFAIASRFPWHNARSAAIFSSVFTFLILSNQLFVSAISVLACIRYLGKPQIP